MDRLWILRLIRVIHRILTGFQVHSTSTGRFDRLVEMSRLTQAGRQVGKIIIGEALRKLAILFRRLLNQVP